MGKKETTVNKVMETAQQLFLDGSYADVTMDQIAAGADVTKGALYHHYSSKEDLYLAMMISDLKEKKALFSTAVGLKGSCQERLRNLTEAFLMLPPKKRLLIKLVRRNINTLGIPTRNQLINAYQEALPNQVQSIIEDGIASKELKPGDPRLLAWSFVALVETVLSLHADRILNGKESKLEFVLNLFLNGACDQKATEAVTDLLQDLATTPTEDDIIIPSAAPTRSVDDPVFPEWRGKDLDDILLECRDLVEDDTYPTLSRWRESGRKILGHFQVYFPEEIAHAADMLPFKVRGGTVEPTHADSRFGSYLCSILKTSMELVLSDRVKLDMFVTHPICDAARNLAAVWGRNFDYPCQILYLPQNANSGYTATYLQGEYDRLQSTVEEISGNRVTQEALSQSIALFNRNRALLRELYEIKRDTPWLVSAEDAYCLVAISGLIPKEEHNLLLETVLPMIRSRTDAKKEDRIRIVFEGGFCEQPPLDLIRMVGQTCYVVDDDLLIGLRWILEDIPTEGDLLHNLADAYLEKSSYSPVQHDLRKPKEKMLQQRVEQSGAEAVILTAAKMCEPGLEEQVAYTHTLDKDGTAYFVSEFEENMTSFDHLGLQLETFMENLLFS